MKFGYRSLNSCGVVFSHDRCDLSIRNVQGEKGFVPSLLRQHLKDRLTVSENPPRTSAHSSTHSSSPSSRACQEDLTTQSQRGEHRPEEGV